MERFSDLAVIAMHYCESWGFEVNEICEVFVTAHPRRLFQASLFDINRRVKKRQTTIVVAMYS